jgi:thiosulfate/3-mercaptopyruvate sulfurtransferase
MRAAALFTECSALAASLAPGAPAALAPTVLDCSWLPPGTSQRALFEQRRIPTARFFDIDAVSDTASPLPHMLPSAGAFAAHMAALRVTRARPVVVYDRHGLLAAARVCWTLRAFGHPAASVLVGGLPRWEAEGRAVEAGPPPPPPPAAPAAPLEPWALAPGAVRSLAQVRALSAAAVAAAPAGGALPPAAPLLVDARATARFTGEAPEPRPGLAAGHIPGSASLPFTALLEGEAARGLQLAAPERLAALLAAAGVDPGRPGDIVLTCGSGVTSCVLLMALLALGRAPGSMAVYDGSFAEWGLPEAGNAIGKGPSARGALLK